MKIRFLLILLLLMSVNVRAQEDCGQPTRFEAGQSGRVTPGEPNNVREEPDRGAALVGQIAGGAGFTALGETMCGGGFTWIEVEFQSAGETLTGWTVEANAADYFVEPLEGRLIELENISFILPEELGDVDVEMNFGADTEPEDQWDFVPYAEFIIGNYLDDPDYQPYNSTIWVLTIDDFEEDGSMLDEAGLYVFDLLPEFLEERPDLSTVEDFPELSPGAVSMLNAFLEYVDFQSGSGYRFMTYYAQDLAGPWSDILSYRYVGLTADGKYMISGELPIRTPEIMREFERPALDLEEAFPVYEAYRQEMLEFYEGFPAEDYEPLLDTLDRLFASFKIED